MKRLYLLPRQGKHLPGEVMQCSILVKAHNIAMLPSPPQIDRAMFWVNESDEDRTVRLLSEAGFRVTSRIRPALLLAFSSFEAEG
jgi:hypothetical protein